MAVPQSHALFGTHLAWQCVQSALPPLCSHSTINLKADGSVVVLVLGGLSHNKWHPVALVATGVHTSAMHQADSHVEVFSAQLDSSEPLARREMCACAVSGSQFLLVSGPDQSDEHLVLWRGALSQIDGEQLLPVRRMPSIVFV